MLFVTLDNRVVG